MLKLLRNFSRLLLGNDCDRGGALITLAFHAGASNEISQSVISNFAKFRMDYSATKKALFFNVNSVIE